MISWFVLLPGVCCSICQHCGLWRHDLWLASICDCGTICDHIMLQYVTRHDLWPKVLQFVTSVIQWLYSPSCAGGKLVFVFTLIMYTKWYNMIIYIYELWYNTYINSGARSFMLFALILFEYHAWHIYILYHIYVSYFMHHPWYKLVYISELNWCHIT